MTLFIADIGIGLICQRLFLRSCHIPLQFQNLDSSGGLLVSLPGNADHTLQITASELLCQCVRLRFGF